MKAIDVQKAWEYVGAVKEGRRDAREQICRAASLIASVADTPALEWLASGRTLASGDAGSVRAALDPAAFCLQVLDAEGSVGASFPLEGKKPSEARSWLRAELSSRGVQAGEDSAGEDEDLPLASVDEAALAEMTRYCANVWHCLRFAVAQADAPDAAIQVSADDLGMSAVVDLAGGASLAIGFGTGDEVCEEFHFYVKPCPAPSVAIDDLPELEGGGAWQSEGWFGGLLPESEWTLFEAEPMQADSASMFLDSAVEGCRGMLEAA